MPRDRMGSKWHAGQLEAWVNSNHISELDCMHWGKGMDSGIQGSAAVDQGDTYSNTARGCDTDYSGPSIAVDKTCPCLG